MQNKLQELTDKLYNEGLSKGREEGEALLAKAKSQAADIVAEAEKKAAEIMTKAEKEAEAYKVKVAGDLKMAASQSVQATRKDIEDLVVFKMTGSATEKALSDEAFVKEVIKAVAEKFNAETAMDLNLVLPETLKSSLEPFVKNELSTILKGQVNASFSKKIAGGFTIGPKDGSYFISLTDETFKELISEYLRPATRKLLFGE
ncbi:uncharacterized protein BN777_01106 [Bacteroides sp. CAG:770]|jgi:hypothetical protein|uniref:hypothetical protein n=2 Tax=Candidatus Cryptobacteroides bacterium TaxID=3085639 RepID=UPI00033C77D1|nr:V-type ATP synthase subunit E [Bacteroidales bacterium]CDC62965.1 uncharacterized protein BN777_01106 [Bacteroides sp. CAG:770]